MEKSDVLQDENIFKIFIYEARKKKDPKRIQYTVRVFFRSATK